MSRSLSDLAALSVSSAELESARQRVLQEQFERVLLKQVEGRSTSGVERLVREAVRIVREEPLEVRRTRGMEVLSGIILRLYCPHVDDSGDLLPLELKSAAQIDGSEESLYTTYLPSTTLADARADAELLLVGEAPAFAETKAGVPLADLWNITSSLCADCRHFPRCFHDAVLVERKSKPRFDARLFGCQFDPCGAACSSTVAFSSRYCYTAGELLRQLLMQCGVARGSWRRYLHSVRPKVFAVVTNSLRRTNLGRSASGGIANRPSDASEVARDAGWLWLEAAMMQPRATVLLGNVALDAFGIACGSKRRGSGVIDYVFPFGMVYKTYHPSALIRTNAILPWNLVQELERALTESADRGSKQGVKWRSHTILVHLFDTLCVAARYVLSGDPLDDRAVGYADILPAFALVTEEVTDVGE